MNRIFSLLIPLLFIVSCNSTKSDKAITDLYHLMQKETIVKLTDLEKRYALNPGKVYLSFKKISEIHHCFKEIYSIIKSGKLDEDTVRLSFEKAIGIYSMAAIQNDIFLKERVSLVEDKFIEGKFTDPDVLLLLSELENKLITKEFDSIDGNSFKFNVLQAVVVPEKTELNVGEDYHAKIYIAAFDTTVGPIIKFKDSYLPLENYGNGVLNIHNSNSGPKEFAGSIEWMIEDQGKIDTLPFKVKYNVK
jgi:hypothetical protein